MAGLPTTPGIREKGVSCCPCIEDNPNPCACASLTVESRTRCGSAAICGFSEYVATNPPKKYRRCVVKGTNGSVAGNGDIINYVVDATADASGLNCGVFSCHTKVIETINGVEHVIQDELLCTNDVIYTTGTISVTPTKKSSVDQQGQTLAATLYNEDKPIDGIKRALASWSAWIPGGACAYIQPPDASGSYAFCEADTRFTAKGSPNAVVKVELTYTQTDMTSGAVMSAHETLELWCDGAGDATQTKIVPCLTGKTTCLTYRKIS